MAEDWNTYIVCPVYKKGNPIVCEIYRVIFLLRTTYKILPYVVLDHLKPYEMDIIGDYQSGFLVEKSTTDRIFTLKWSMNTHYEFNKQFYLLFVGFGRARDSVKKREALFRNTSNCLADRPSSELRSERV